MTSSQSTVQCKRFLGISKRIPKDVKRHCGICRQHGEIVETRGHNCPRRDCECEKCDLVRRRRSLMSTQIRLRREQDKQFQRTSNKDDADIVLAQQDLQTVNTCYVCQKCKNHGILKWKKEHKKNCAFANCDCAQCMLIDSRRAIDRTIKGGRNTKNRSNQEDEIKNNNKGESHPLSPVHQRLGERESSSSSSSLEDKTPPPRSSCLITALRAPSSNQHTTPSKIQPNDEMQLETSFSPVMPCPFKFQTTMPPFLPLSCVLTSTSGFAMFPSWSNPFLNVHHSILPPSLFLVPPTVASFPIQTAGLHGLPVPINKPRPFSKFDVLSLIS